MKPFSRVHQFLIFFFLFLFLSSINPSSSRQIVVAPFSIPSRISYPQHCGKLIPESNPTTNTNISFKVPTFFGAYVINGNQFFEPTSKISANFIPRKVFNADVSGVFKLEASMAFRVSSNHSRNLLNVYGGPRFAYNPRSLRFLLSGFWNSASGQLCMVGFGAKTLPNGYRIELDVVYKSTYPNNTVITSSLVTGSLESLNLEGSDGHFKPISILGFAKSNYEYTLINEVDIDGEFQLGSNALSNVSMGSWGPFHGCSYFGSFSEYFELAYENSDCDGRKCNQLDGVFGFLPKFMSLNEIDCSEVRRVRVVFGFSENSDIRNGYRQRLDPRKALVAEGSWNSRNNQLCFVACRILNVTDSPLSASIGDCSIRVNFSFPAFLTIRNPSVMRGHIWSNKSADEPGYFDRSEIRASGSLREAPREMKYNYTEVERVKKFCAEKKVSKSIGKSYPGPFSSDLKFDMDVRNGKGQLAWGRSHPVFVGDHLVSDTYRHFGSSVVPRAGSDFQVDGSLSGLLNISYQLVFSPLGEYKVGSGVLIKDRKTIIYAEGIYDTKSGRLCMVGCWNRETGSNGILNASAIMDCDIFINFQIPPQDSNSVGMVKGTIESKRDKSDPLYFDQLDVTATSLTKFQVEKAFWRMDFEITMLLISNTLTCIFVGLQLFHVKRHRDVLPLISLVMLTVITLGHMIPLLLNMEAVLLSRPSKRTVLFGSGGWLEVNEVLVRVITMLAFLLEFRLLQLTWYARGAEESSKNLGASEKKVICYSLPLYAVGALIAWILHSLRGSQTKRLHFRHITLESNSNPSLPFMNDVKSYGGFILDTFLLPQIIFNFFSDSRDKALSLPFYIGTTIVRLLPHAYDLFRAHSSAWKFDPWYIYANPGMNYYSTTWDILISCLGLVFVIIIYLQQRFGGRSVLPRRFRENVTYEKVPVGL